MSQVTKPILLDETGKEIAGVLRQQNALLSAMARESVNALATDWKGIQNIVREGLASEIFRVGDQLTVSWEDVAADKDYDVPLDIVHFGDVTLKNGSVVPAMFLQWHYCIPFDMQFDHQENEVASESSFSSDYFYYEAYTDGNKTRYKLLEKDTDYIVGDTIPTSKTYYHSSIKDTTGEIVGSGYNRWSHSALRQFLNSAGGKSEWWTAQHLGDVAPDQHASKAGFMSGFSEDFLSCLKPIKVTTMLNTITDTELGDREDTYDTFFLPSLEQIWAKQSASTEGEAFEYWKLAVGKTEPNGLYNTNINPAYITYGLEGGVTGAQRVFLRSAYQSSSYSPWIMLTGGYIGANYAASNARRCAPVCAIC